MQKIKLYKYSYKIDKIKYTMIDVNSIVYFHNTGNNGIIAYTKDVNYKLDSTLDVIQNKHSVFFRANQYYLININSIDKLLPYWVDNYRVLRMKHSNTDIYLTESNLNNLAVVLGMNRISEYTPIVNKNSKLRLMNIV